MDRKTDFDHRWQRRYPYGTGANKFASVSHCNEPAAVATRTYQSDIVFWQNFILMLDMIFYKPDMKRDVFVSFLNAVFLISLADSHTFSRNETFGPFYMNHFSRSFRKLSRNGTSRSTAKKEN
jgi:hypothetical protein